MNTIELFCGTKSFSKVAKKRNHNIFTVDIEKCFQADLTIDILKLDAKQLPRKCDFLWASPPCQGFSVAVIGRNWTTIDDKVYPKSQSARNAIKLVKKTLSLIEEIKPKYFVIENPRGMLRKTNLLKNMRHVCVTYCQYGDKRMKPTDLWTNIPEDLWKPKPACKNGDPCHESAPRGSRTGTQGIKSVVARGMIPYKLIEEIISSVE